MQVRKEDWNSAEKFWLLQKIRKDKSGDSDSQIGFLDSRLDLFEEENREHVIRALKNYPLLVQTKCDAVLRFPSDKEILDLIRPHLETELLETLQNFETGGEHLSSLKTSFEEAGLPEFTTMVETILTRYAKNGKTFDEEDKN